MWSIEPLALCLELESRYAARMTDGSDSQTSDRIIGFATSILRLWCGPSPRACILVDNPPPIEDTGKQVPPLKMDILHRMSKFGLNTKGA